MPNFTSAHPQQRRFQPEAEAMTTLPMEWKRLIEAARHAAALSGFLPSLASVVRAVIHTGRRLLANVQRVRTDGEGETQVSATVWNLLGAVAGVLSTSLREWEAKHANMHGKVLTPVLFAFLQIYIWFYEIYFSVPRLKFYPRFA
jgi:hypothetical protein